MIQSLSLMKRMFALSLLVRLQSKVSRPRRSRRPSNYRAPL